MLALCALDFVADDADRLTRFAGLAGEPADDLRRRASNPGFLAAVLDFLLEDEPTLLAFADRRGIPPDAPRDARRRLRSEARWPEARSRSARRPRKAPDALAERA